MRIFVKNLIYFFWMTLFGLSCTCDSICIDHDYYPPRVNMCNSVDDPSERKRCADKEMLMALYREIKYPAEAREDNIEGTVIVKIDINLQGEVIDIFSTTSLGYGLEVECIRVVTKMSEEIGWVPAIQSCTAMRDTFILPVKFKLQ